jgi:hypothetical protein
MQPVEFVATLIETATRFTGATHETAWGGGERLFATLDGERNGSSVNFLKTYDTPDERYDLPIRYVGSLNADASQITGRWTIMGHASGTFVMMREMRKARARKRKAQVHL